MREFLKWLVVVVCVVGGFTIGSSTHVKLCGVYEIQDLLWIIAFIVFFLWLAWKELFPKIDKKFPPDPQ